LYNLLCFYYKFALVIYTHFRILYFLKNVNKQSAKEIKIKLIIFLFNNLVDNLKLIRDFVAKSKNFAKKFFKLVLSRLTINLKTICFIFIFFIFINNSFLFLFLFCFKFWKHVNKILKSKQKYLSSILF